jgi:hypothetical protein
MRSPFSRVGPTKKSMSPVRRGYPWNATAWPPTTRYSTFREFSNPTNSLKSLCSLAKGAPVPFNQLQKDVHSLLGGKVRVVFLVGAIRIRKAAENLGDVFHAGKCTTASLVRPPVVQRARAPSLCSVGRSDGLDANLDCLGGRSPPVARYALRLRLGTALIGKLRDDHPRSASRADCDLHREPRLLPSDFGGPHARCG